MPVAALKSAFLKHRLQKEAAQVSRQKLLIPWEEVRTIGIMYDVPEETDYVRFTSYLGQLQSEKKELKTLGLTTSKVPPHYCYPRLAFDYFGPREINWYGKPGGPKVADFIRNDFDVMVNLSLSGNGVYDYIAAVSSARLKCGLYREDAVNWYDFMIRMRTPDHPEDLMDQIITWLKNIKG